LPLRSFNGQGIIKNGADAIPTTTGEVIGFEAGNGGQPVERVGLGGVSQDQPGCEEREKDEEGDDDYKGTQKQHEEPVSDGADTIGMRHGQPSNLYPTPWTVMMNSPGSSFRRRLRMCESMARS
jgi:hypothetical protein